MIKDYRNEIEAIDLEIQSLLKKRLDVSKKIGAYKKENNLPIFDPKREEEIISNLDIRYENDEYLIYYKELMRKLFALSKELQNE